MHSLRQRYSLSLRVSIGQAFRYFPYHLFYITKVLSTLFGSWTLTQYNLPIRHTLLTVLRQPYGISWDPSIQSSFSYFPALLICQVTLSSSGSRSASPSCRRWTKRPVEMLFDYSLSFIEPHHTCLLCPLTGHISVERRNSWFLGCYRSSGGRIWTNCYFLFDARSSLFSFWSQVKYHIKIIWDQLFIVFCLYFLKNNTERDHICFIMTEEYTNWFDFVFVCQPGQ